MPAGTSRVWRRARAYATVFSVLLQDALTYRSQAVIWLLTDAVPALVLPVVWLAAYNGRATVGGFAPSQIVAYYVLVLFLSNAMSSHILWDMASDIKEGRLSIYLTRPMGYMTYQYLSSLAWRMMRSILFVPLLLGAIWLFRGFLRWEGFHYGAAFWAAIALGHLLSFVLAFTLGLLSLFLVQARDVYNFYYMLAGILAGQTIPLAMLPPWMRAAADWLPFRYTLGFPAELFLGQAQGPAVAHGFAIELAWLVGLYVTARLLWRSGLKQFTGVGI